MSRNAGNDKLIGKNNEAVVHYENLLANVYDWMVGDDFESNVASQRILLEQLLLTASTKQIAVDLGCGSGFQTFALAQMGYEKILSIDTSSLLLEKLQSNVTKEAIVTYQADLLDFSEFLAPASADLVICMGDTVTHLQSLNDVQSLLESCYRCLKLGGHLVLTFRNYSEQLLGASRFIPVRSDLNRIMSCFLEYKETHVQVHDILHQREGETWTQSVSSYPKLRLFPEALCESLQKQGYEVVTSKPAGRMHTIVAVKGELA